MIVCKHEKQKLHRPNTILGHGAFVQCTICWCVRFWGTNNWLSKELAEKQVINDGGRMPPLVGDKS